MARKKTTMTEPEYSDTNPEETLQLPEGEVPTEGVQEDTMSMGGDVSVVRLCPTAVRFLTAGPHLAMETRLFPMRNRPLRMTVWVRAFPVRNRLLVVSPGKMPPMTPSTKTCCMKWRAPCPSLPQRGTVRLRRVIRLR